EVHVERHVHLHDVVFEAGVAEARRRNVLVREVELQLVHANPAQALEVHLGDVRPDEEPALAERLGALTEDRARGGRSLHREPADELERHAARGGRNWGVADARADRIRAEIEDAPPARGVGRDEVLPMSDQSALKAERLATRAEREQLFRDPGAQVLTQERTGETARREQRNERATPHDGLRESGGATLPPASATRNGIRDENCNETYFAPCDSTFPAHLRSPLHQRSCGAGCWTMSSSHRWPQGSNRCRRSMTVTSKSSRGSASAR